MTVRVHLIAKNIHHLMIKHKKGLTASIKVKSGVNSIKKHHRRCILVMNIPIKQCSAYNFFSLMFYGSLISSSMTIKCQGYIKNLRAFVFSIRYNDFLTVPHSKCWYYYMHEALDHAGIKVCNFSFEKLVSFKNMSGLI